jgi:putative heme-binding domain-containing protein
LGNAIGPDLSRIGRVRGGLDLLEAIVQPDTRLVPGFETYRVRTKSGAVNGILVEESATAVALQVNATRVMRLPTAAIESFDSVPASIMPSGLHEGLTENQLRDLLAFLRSLRGG